jgi:hypothetical protein
MTLQRSEDIHVSVLAPPDELYTWLRNVGNWRGWAPWIHSVAPLAPGEWRLDTDAGAMKVRFVEPNGLGVLDHRVELSTGATVFNSMRVLPNGSGSELVMVVFQGGTASADDFDRDVAAVRADLARIRQLAEARD